MMSEKQTEHAPAYEATPIPPTHQQHHQAAVAATSPSHAPPPQPMQQFGGPQHGQYQYHNPQHPTMPPMNEGAMYQQEMMAQCARGNHSYNTKYGVVGIIVAVCLFPCGLLALCCDKKEICTRCGHQTF